jgi:hypothetical protein
MIVPNKRSPLAVVLPVAPLLGVALCPCAAAITSRDPDVATPEYSSIATRSVAVARIRYPYGVRPTRDVLCVIDSERVAFIGLAVLNRFAIYISFRIDDRERSFAAPARVQTPIQLPASLLACCTTMVELVTK